MAFPAVAEVLPLHTGNGWDIPVARSGTWVLSSYSDKALSTKAFRYLARQDASEIYGFVLRLNPGVTLLWTQGSKIELAYMADDKLYSVASDEFFFFSGDLKRIIRGGDVRYVAVPGVIGSLFCTNKGNVIVFARFPFVRFPDELEFCEVVQVQERGTK